jgi:two-component system LytT family sensor kinase
MNERLRRWLMYWGVWMLLGVYMATMDAVMFPKMRFFGSVLPMNLLQNLAWGTAGLGVLALARRWPLEHFTWVDRKNWAIHLFGSVMIAIFTLWIIWLISLGFAESAESAKALSDPFKSYFHFFSEYFHINLLLMWAVLGAFHGIRIFERYRKREVQAAQLESQLAVAQTQALQMQLQPHFLFNTLNSIAALIHSDAEAADQMVSRLADLLRMTLDSGTGQEISLRQEMAFADAYLGIEGIRFQDRLTVIKDVPFECLDAMVPAFLLQPLAENAIKHGVADMAGPSTIEIRARHEQEWLILEWSWRERELQEWDRHPKHVSKAAIDVQRLPHLHIA